MSKVQCSFCREEGTKAKEHIWPKWLQKELTGSTKSNYRGTHLSLAHFQVVSERMQSGETLVFGNICIKCNNGWMSKLEVEFLKVFKKIQKNYSILNTLSKEERSIISVWGLKTSMMINSGTNYRKIIPEKHYEHLYKYRHIPKDVKIDIAYIESEHKLMWEQSNFTMAIMGKGENPDSHDLIKNSYVISMQLENLGIKVMYYDDCKEKGYEIVESKEAKSIRIWPYVKNGKFKISNSYKEIANFHLDTLLKK